MNTPNNLGVVADTRTPAQKEFDYKHEEIYTSSVPSYLADYAAAASFVGAFPIDDQQGTSSCVAHGKVLVMSIFNYLQGGASATFRQLSSMFIYRNRINYPGEGMVPSSADMQTITTGAPIYADLPTPATEAEANALVVDAAMTASAKEFAAGKWVSFINENDVDQMAFVSNQLGLPMNILIYATIAEWSASVVRILTPGLKQSDPLAVVEHCVTILPKSAYKGTDGLRYVIIQDSAGFGGIFFREVCEDFLTARVTESAYMIAMGGAPVEAKPKVNLTADLTVGSSGPDVTALQEALQYLGYLPNVINGAPFAPTGLYAGMTKNAVLKLQNEYAAEILTPQGLTVGTGYTGLSTREFLNKMFS